MRALLLSLEAHDLAPEKREETISAIHEALGRLHGQRATLKVVPTTGGESRELLQLPESERIRWTSVA